MINMTAKKTVTVDSLYIDSISLKELKDRVSELIIEHGEEAYIADIYVECDNLHCSCPATYIDTLNVMKVLNV